MEYIPAVMKLLVWLKLVQSISEENKHFNRNMFNKKSHQQNPVNKITLHLILAESPHFQNS